MHLNRIRPALFLIASLLILTSSHAWAVTWDGSDPTVASLTIDGGSLDMGGHTLTVTNIKPNFLTIIDGTYAEGTSVAVTAMPMGTLEENDVSHVFGGCFIDVADGR